MQQCCIYMRICIWPHLAILKMFLWWMYLSSKLFFHSLCSAFKVPRHRIFNSSFGWHGPDHILVLTAGGIGPVAWRQGRAHICILIIVIIFICGSTKSRRQCGSQHRRSERLLWGYNLQSEQYQLHFLYQCEIFCTAQLMTFPVSSVVSWSLVAKLVQRNHHGLLAVPLPCFGRTR